MGILHPAMLDRLGVFFDKTCTVYENISTSEDEYGELVDDWAVVQGMDSIPCVVGNNEAMDTEGENATVSVVNTYKIMLQGYYPGITGDMRVVVSGTTYNILSVHHSQENAHTRLIVEVLR